MMKLPHPLAVIGVALNVFVTFSTLSVLDGKPLLTTLFFASLALSCAGLGLLRAGKNAGAIVGIFGSLIFLPLGFIAILGFILARRKNASANSPVRTATEAQIGRPIARDYSQRLEAQKRLNHSASEIDGADSNGPAGTSGRSDDARPGNKNASGQSGSSSPSVPTYTFRDTRMRTAVLIALGVLMVAVVAAKFKLESGRAVTLTVFAGALYMLVQRRFKSLPVLALQEHGLTCVPSRRLWAAPLNILYADIVRAGLRGSDGFVTYKDGSGNERTAPVLLSEIDHYFQREATERFATKMRQQRIPFQG